MDFDNSAIGRDNVEKIINDFYNSTQVTNINLSPVSSERIGLLGDYAVMNVTFISEDEREKNVEFFVKFFPKMPLPAKFAEEIGAFKKEIFIYELFDSMKKQGIKILSSCVPSTYLKRHDELIVMDNLLMEGYVKLNKRKLLDYDALKTVLEALAKLHASSLIYEESMSKELNKKYRLIDEYQEQFEESFFNNRENFGNLKGFEASVKGIVNSIKIFNFPETLLSGKQFREILQDVCYKIYDLVKPSSKFRNVVNHGDLWTTNFLIKYLNDKPVQCKLVDFQYGRYIPPAADVMALIYLTSSREFRQNYMYDLIGLYYTNLEKHLTLAGYQLKDIIPFDDFLNSCEEYKLFALLQTAIYFPLILINNDTIEKYLDDLELNQKALFEDRSYLVLEHMNNDEYYRTRIVESLQDLKDYCDYL